MFSQFYEIENIQKQHHLHLHRATITIQRNFDLNKNDEKLRKSQLTLSSIKLN